MAQIKLIAIDLDGTLLTDDKQLPPENAAAIQAAIEHNVKVVICTGRPLVGVKDLLSQLPNGNDDEFMIVNNGVVTHRLPSLEIVAETNLPTGVREELYNIYKHYRHTSIQMTGTDLHHFYVVETEQPSSIIREDAAMLKIDITLLSIEKFMRKEGIYKSIFYGLPEDLDQMENDLPAYYNELASIVRSQPYILEFLPKGVNKATGLKALAAYLNIRPEETMAIGDEMNDYEMLEYAGVGVATANAHPKILELADFVTLSNNKAGVAHAIQEYVTGPL